MPLQVDSPVCDLAELVARMNEASRPRPDGLPRWTPKRLLRMLRAAKVELVQAGRRGKVWVPLAALKRAFPDLWESLLDAEALREAA